MIIITKICVEGVLPEDVKPSHDVNIEIENNQLKEEKKRIAEENGIEVKNVYLIYIEK